MGRPRQSSRTRTAYLRCRNASKLSEAQQGAPHRPANRVRHRFRRTKCLAVSRRGFALKNAANSSSLRARRNVSWRLLSNRSGVPCVWRNGLLADTGLRSKRNRWLFRGSQCHDNSLDGSILTTAGLESFFRERVEFSSARQLRPYDHDNSWPFAKVNRYRISASNSDMQMCMCHSIPN